MRRPASLTERSFEPPASSAKTSTPVGVWTGPLVPRGRLWHDRRVDAERPRLGEEMNRGIRGLRRSITSVGAVFTLLAAAVVGASGAAAVPTPLSGTGTVRIAGADRYATAVQISRRSFSGPEDYALIASGENWPDALALGPAAFAIGGEEGGVVFPLLLVRRDSVPSVVVDELRRLQPSRIFIAGGTAAISSATAARLAALAPEGVTRFWGADRYATAVAVQRGTYGSNTARTFLASGQGFADGVAAGATAAHFLGPILLTPQDKLAPATEAALRLLDPAEFEGTHQVFIVGGPGAISLAVEARVKAVVKPGVEVIRVAGKNRYETAKALAGLWAATSEWPAPVNAFVASGTTFADALAATPAAGINQAPMLLTTATCTPTATAAALAAIQPRLTVYLGGPAVSYAGTRAC